MHQLTTIVTTIVALLLLYPIFPSQKIFIFFFSRLGLSYYNTPVSFKTQVGILFIFLLFPIRYRGYRNSEQLMLNQLRDISFFLFISKVIHIIMFVVYFSQECDFTHNNRSDILYDSLLKYHIKLYSFIHWIPKVKKIQRLFQRFFLTFDTPEDKCTHQ